MAAVATETVNIVVNDVEIAVPKGELIVESVKRLGLEIPIFCYHPRMKPVGMCRMCLVEVGFKQPDGSVRKMPKPQAACTLPASEGMVVFTDSEMVHRDRKGVLEFLLINHPLDCPICDRGGECPLQNNTIFYGPSTSRFIELKRHAPKAFPLSKHVTLDLERCIQCGRCVRFTEEISGDSELAFRFRGASMQPSTFELRDFSSKFSGNVIEICPVGALTNRNYRFRARPWDLETKPGVCTVCSNGCNIWMDYRVGKMVRVNGRTNEAVNEEWTCDRGKFGHEHYNATDRLTKPLIRKGDHLEECDWPEAYSAILQAFSAGGSKVAALGGDTLSNESAYLFRKIFKDLFNSTNVDYRWYANLQSTNDHVEKKLGSKMVQSSLGSLESKSTILVFGTSLADELPIVHLRVRKAWFNQGSRVIVAHSQPTDADSFAHLVLRYKQGTGHILAGALVTAAREAGHQVPTTIQASSLSVADAATECGVSEAHIREAVTLLNENAAVVSSRALFDLPESQLAIEALAGLAVASKAEFNCYSLTSNEQGIEELGYASFGGNTYDIVRDCKMGAVEALWVVGNDPLELAKDSANFLAAIEEVSFLVVQSTHHSEITKYASVVLPMTAPAEEEGTYTNCERRVQRMKPVFAGKGEAKPGWKIFTELMVRSNPSKPYFNASEIFNEISTNVPAFSGLSYSQLDGEGALLK